MKQRWEYDTSKAIDELEAELNLRITVPYWDSMAKLSYTPSNYKDIEKYIEHYAHLKNEDKKFILVEIILDALAEQPEENLFWQHWRTVKKILIKDFRIHEFTINYWKDMTEVNFENCKYLSPELKVLLEEVEAKNE